METAFEKMYRRRPQRFGVQLPVLNRNASDHLKNLSVQGGFVESLPEQSGSLVDLVFAFPGQRDRFCVTGRVEWVRGGERVRPGMGVKFLLFREGSPAELLRYLQYWGEKRDEQILEAHFTPANKPQPPGCRGMTPESEFMFLLTDITDEDINEALGQITPEANVA